MFQKLRVGYVPGLYLALPQDVSTLSGVTLIMTAAFMTLANSHPMAVPTVGHERAVGAGVVMLLVRY